MTMRVSALAGHLNEVKRAPIGGVKFDYVMLFAAGWLLGGGYLDAWAHNNIPSLETFFTPWHGVLYSGFLAVALVMVGVCVLNRRRIGTWVHVVPEGYGLTLLGVAGFAVGGVSDMLWHILFGIERNTDAALSPTHLFLMVCFGLIASGPLRAMWRRTDASPTFFAQLPLILAFTLFWSVFTLVSQAAHPFLYLAPTNVPSTMSDEQLLSVLGMIFQTTVLIGLLLLVMRRWQLAPGFLTVSFTINAILLSFMQYHFIVIPIAALAGLGLDVLYYYLKPSLKRPAELRIFAFAVPAVLYLIFFLALLFTSGIVWSIHLAGGSVVVTGIVGWLLSYLLVPPYQSSTVE